MPCGCQVVCLDVDEALIDLRSAMHEPIARALHAIRGVVSGAEALAAPELIAIRDRVATEVSAEAPMEEIRWTAFERTLAEFGGDTARADEITEQYLADRLRPTHPCDDVVSTLDVLRRNHARAGHERQRWRRS